MKTILVVDDDASIGALLTDVLTREGYRVLRAYSGTEALLVLRTERPDLVLLDLMLPGLTGEEVLAQLAGIPVIVVSARVGVDDKVDCLLGGAADYITKPFDTRELLARIAVQLRAAPQRTGAQPLTFDAVTLDPARHTVTVAGEAVRLTKTEYAILKRLMQSPTQVMTKTQLLELISEDTPDCVESSLSVHISNLRRKLREKSGKNYIEAVWGIGFKLCGG